MTDYTSANVPWSNSKTAIETITIGSGVTKIGNNAFNGCTGLKSLISLNPSAPAVSNSNAFTDVPFASAFLYVPQGAAGYTGTGWSGFPNRQDIPDNVPAVYGQTLAEVLLPSNPDNGSWSWMDGGILLDNLGTQTHAAKFTPTAANTAPVESIDVTVLVAPIVNAATPTVDAQPTGGTYTQGETAAALSVTASVSDGGTLSYEWFGNTEDGNSGGTAVGTGTTYTPSTAAVGTLYYYVVVTNTNEGVNGTKTATATSVAVGVVVSAPTCTVTFVDWDDAVLDVQTVEHGSGAIAPTNPDNRPGWHFVEWDVAYSNVTADLAVTAVYEINKYTVTFLGYNDVELKVQTGVEHGSAATAPTPPTVTGYTFKEWDVAYNNVTADLAVTAVYEIIKYTVTFLGYNDVELKVQTDVEHGSAATPPTPPTVTGYTFKDWDVAYNNVTGNVTVTAVYEINRYTVTFLGYNDVELKVQTGVEHGSSATPPTPPTVTGYTFKEWDVAYNSVTADVTVRAVYEINRYTVTFLGYNDVELKVQTGVEHGSAATAPTPPLVTGYTFSNWDKAYNNVTGDLTVTAVYEQIINAATPNITTQPVGKTYTQNAAAMALSVTASVTDGGTLSYQWYSNTTNSTASGTAVGTGATYTPSTAAVGTLYYYVVVTNTNNSVNGTKTATVTSSVVSVAVNTAPSSVLAPDRVTPQVDPDEEATVIAPVTVLAGEFTAGPNPVSRELGVVNFFRQGKRIANCELRVYDATGNVVGKVKISDNALGNQSRRKVGSWDLRDRKGRQVSEGTYLVKGVLTASDGKSEKVSVIVGVR